MQFTTPIPVTPSPTRIDHHSRLLLLGSCFSNTIGELLRFHGFRATVNPLGIAYHPANLRDQLRRAARHERFSADTVFERNGKYQSFETHSELAGKDSDDALSRMNAGLAAYASELAATTHVFITLGSAWGYRHLEQDLLVANCHKVPQSAFRKELLGTDEASALIAEIRNVILQANPSAEVIFTISPVRHLKDGFIGNQRSKSSLIFALHQFLDESPGKTAYFPSYEIVMDELRDYRFYGTDMLHPSKNAIGYIWERFSDTYFNEETLSEARQVAVIRRAMQHRPFREDFKEYVRHRERTELRASEIIGRYPWISFI